MRFGCFGKLPVSPEFLVEGARELGESGFDRWIGEGVGLAKARLGPRFDPLMRSFPAYRFLWGGGRPGRRLCGVLAPGEDKAGRKHPFSVFAIWEGSAPPTALASALAACAIQHQAGLLLEASRQADTPGRVLEVVRSAGNAAAPGPGGAGPAEARYRLWLRGRTGGSFWQPLGEEAQPELRFDVMQAWVETVDPAPDGRVFRGAIRFPLPAGDPEQACLHSAFWIEMTETKLGRIPGPCWLWTDGNEPALFLFLSQPTAAQWASLLDPEARLDSISDLHRPYGSEPARRRMQPPLRQMLETESAGPEEYLRWAGGS